MYASTATAYILLGVTLRGQHSKASTDGHRLLQLFSLGSYLRTGVCSMRPACELLDVTQWESSVDHITLLEAFKVAFCLE